MVIDTSAVVAVLLEEPERPALIRATTGVVLFAPASLPWELGNALMAATCPEFAVASVGASWSSWFADSGKPRACA